MLKTLGELLFSSEEHANYLKWSIQINDGALDACGLYVAFM